ncbi:MAG: hypothetical protein B7X33_02870 [Lysobacterales bacterium 13-68-4]|jgi:hypothetical protein|nr:MAG: hypothetical protein B7X45_02000 [Xanthomonadales bacterium 15-68-25]OZB68529.1 MAG: hypothetical protein B7X39_01360 [Xanthomonadales bacterium 14-68-21]OZB70210.1 MAG: hypothetical protein B7X33_02870 [Xanthomonadales bacterium 13-68-4]
MLVMFLEPLRMFFLTRPLTFAASGTFRLSPLLAMLAWRAGGTAPPTQSWWLAAMMASVALIMLMHLVERRCSTPDRSFHGGLLVIAASVSSGWMALDVLLVLAALLLAQAIACLLALGGDPPEDFQELVLTFYRHRLLQ